MEEEIIETAPLTPETFSQITERLFSVGPKYPDCCALDLLLVITLCVQEHPVPVLELAEQMNISETTLRKSLRRLNDAGWIQYGKVTNPCYRKAVTVNVDAILNYEGIAI